VDERTAAVLVSSVFFGSGRIVHGLGDLLAACRRHGAELMVDAYHSLGVVPLSLPEEDLGDAYLVGGGYKYLQMGEGNCFLRVPPGRRPRPVITGWFAEFAELAAPKEPGQVGYGAGAAAFAGSTYDPTSHYRAVEVLDFFTAQGLDPTTLRRISQHQVGLLARRFDDLDLPPALITRDRSVPPSEIGGFLALATPRAAELADALRQRGVATDHRGQVLRLGPAPYLSDRQLEEAIAHLGEAARELAPGA
jgi:kynureninase